MRRTKDWNSREREKIKTIISDKTGYYINANCLLIQTFTRRSYTVEHGGENNEILEFIGDQILSYYVIKIITERFGALNSDYEYTCRLRENDFTGLKHELVSNEALAKIIDEWGIVEYLIVGKSDYLNEVDNQIKVKADLFEAILGAIAVESKWNSDVLERVVSKMLSIDKKLNSIITTEYRPAQFDIENAVNTLKELAEHGSCSIPEYDTPENPVHDKDGNPRWCCTCFVISEKTGITRQVWSTSKKSAKRGAAYLVLCDLLELQNQYGVNGKYTIWQFQNGKLMPGI